MISGLPLAALGYLIPAAREWERQEQRAAAEKRLFPIWYAGKITHELTGGKGDYIKYSDFIKNIERGAEHTERKHEPAAPPRTGEDIINDFLPLIEADRGRGGG